MAVDEQSSGKAKDRRDRAGAEAIDEVEHSPGI